MSKNAVITYIYPNALKYLPYFIECINSSTTDDFEVIFFNDCIENLNSFISAVKVNYKIFDVTGSVNMIRYKSFEILKDLNFENIIFQDIDDNFSNNRLDENINLLRISDIVITDLNIVSNGVIVKKNIWKKRLSILEDINYLNIKKYNFFGLGNTAIKKKLLNTKIFHSEDVLAYDWYIFYQILRHKTLKVKFTSACTVNYLQHENNIAGLNKSNTIARLNHVYNVKLKHYNALIQIGYSEIIKELIELKQFDINNINIKNKQPELFWWEEIK